MVSVKHSSIAVSQSRHISNASSQYWSVKLATNKRDQVRESVRFVFSLFTPYLQTSTLVFRFMSTIMLKYLHVVVFHYIDMT